jgi:transposase InsO family protein
MSIQAGVEDADPAVSDFSARSAQRARATDLSTAPSAPGASWGVMVSRSAVTGWLSLMRKDGMAGVIRRRRHTTTIPDESLAARARDLVDRNFTATGPNQLWVADFTPVECAGSHGTVKRSRPADAADHWWCASHTRYSWGFRLYGVFASDSTPSPRRQ